MHRLCALWLAGLVAGCSTVNHGTSPAETISTVGIVDYGEFDDSETWFSLYGIDQGFVVEAATVPDMDALTGALKSSNETGRGVRVTFDVQSGVFERGSRGSNPTYVVRSIEYDGTIIRGMSGPRSTGTQPQPAETALARGVAYAGGFEFERAVPFLDQALSDAGLPPELKALAHNIRGHALIDSAWDTHQEATDAVDRQLMRALADFTEWADLEPGNPEARLAVGLALRDLGDYERAIAIFRAMIPAWPEQRIRLVTRIGATYRILGDYDRALGVLDELVAREGPQPGMMFHYHRGWTLNLMGRYEEAIKEFNEGFESQSDYSGAFGQRACSFARLGRLEEALADRRMADKLMESNLRGTGVTPAREHDRAWSRAVIATLEAAIASGSKEPNAAPCEGDWNYGDRKRERSRLLPDTDSLATPVINAI
jgi:tetratricopeptide (TPR) repeat protein